MENQNNETRTEASTLVDPRLAPTTNDFEILRRELLPTNDTPIRMVGDVADGFTSLSKMIRAHIKRLWCKQLYDNNDQIATEIIKLEPRAIRQEILDFIKCREFSEEWQVSRERELEARLDRIERDRADVGSDIDIQYDRLMTMGRSVVEEELQRIIEYQEVLKSSPAMEVNDKGKKRAGRLISREIGLPAVVNTMKELYLLQRLARGKATDKTETVSSGDKNSELYEKRLRELESVLNARTVEATPLNPI